MSSGRASAPDPQLPRTFTWRTCVAADQVTLPSAAAWLLGWPWRLTRPTYSGIFLSSKEEWMEAMITCPLDPCRWLWRNSSIDFRGS